MSAARDACPGLRVAGILSPKAARPGEAEVIEALDPASGQRLLLARRRPSVSPHAGSATPRWAFDPAALAWGETLLRAATPCDLLVVDELGPLEFERAEGWVGGLAAVDGGAYRVALVVVRPRLLGHARRRWPRARLLTLVDPARAAATARALAAELAPRLRPG